MSEFTQKRVNILKPESEHYLVSLLGCHILALLDNRNPTLNLLRSPFLLLAQKWGHRVGGGKGKSKHRLCQMKLLNQACQGPGTIYVWSRHSIHLIYFIICLLWAVTWQKCHACKIEALFSKPFSSLSSGNIYSLGPLQALWRTWSWELETYFFPISVVNLLCKIPAPLSCSEC